MFTPLRKAFNFTSLCDESFWRRMWRSSFLVDSMPPVSPSCRSSPSPSSPRNHRFCPIWQQGPAKALCSSPARCPRAELMLSVRNPFSCGRTSRHLSFQVPNKGTMQNPYPPKSCRVVTANGAPVALWFPRACLCAKRSSKPTSTEMIIEVKTVTELSTVRLELLWQQSKQSCPRPTWLWYPNAQEGAAGNPSKQDTCQQTRCTSNGKTRFTP